MTSERPDVEAIRADAATWVRPCARGEMSEAWMREMHEARARLAAAAPKLADELEAAHAALAEAERRAEQAERQVAAVEKLAERWRRAEGRGKHAARRAGALAAQLFTVLHAKDNDVAQMLADPDAYFASLRSALSPSEGQQ